jgi:glycosyltransferase involved in cell wall biosynthesis
VAKNVAIRLYRSYWAKRWGFGFGALKRIFSVCRQSTGVYVYGIATWPTTLGAIFCYLFGQRYVVGVHGGLMPEHVAHIRRHMPWKWLYYKVLTLPFLRQATALHCTSEAEAQGVWALLGDDTKCVIAANGVDLSRFTPDESPPSTEHTLCYVGRISKEKGINEFLRTWLRCRTSQEKIIVVGAGDGCYFKEFLELVHEPGSGIDYRGYVGPEGVFSVLKQSRFLVLPSGLGKGDVRENFGNAIAEALSAGRPVMVTRGLSWDHLEQENAGIIFDRNEETARAAIEKARAITMTDWARMATASRAYAERDLDIQIHAERIMSVLRG